MNTFKRNLSSENPLPRAFASLSRDLHRQLANDRNRSFRGTRGVFPAVNLHESDTGYVLTAELPGVAPENIDVSIEGATVTLSGERKVEHVAGDGVAVHRRERQSGTFRRAFELPAEIDLDAAKATHRNGVLTLDLPKTAAVQPRQIPVETP